MCEDERVGEVGEGAEGAEGEGQGVVQGLVPLLDRRLEGHIGFVCPLLLSDVTKIFRSRLRFSTLPSLSISILLCFADAN